MDEYFYRVSNGREVSDEKTILGENNKSALYRAVKKEIEFMKPFRIVFLLKDRGSKIVSGIYLTSKASTEVYTRRKFPRARLEWNCDKLYADGRLMQLREAEYHLNVEHLTLDKYLE